MKYFLPLLVILTSVIGSLANIYINVDDWYLNLTKSPLNPPSFVFGIVWPILYAIMAFVSFKMADKIAGLFIMQLVTSQSSITKKRIINENVSQKIYKLGSVTCTSDNWTIVSRRHGPVWAHSRGV